MCPDSEAPFPGCEEAEVNGVDAAQAASFNYPAAILTVVAAQEEPEAPAEPPAAAPAAETPTFTG